MSGVPTSAVVDRPQARDMRKQSSWHGDCFLPVVMRTKTLTAVFLVAVGLSACTNSTVSNDSSSGDVAALASGDRTTLLFPAATAPLVVGDRTDVEQTSIAYTPDDGLTFKPSIAHYFYSPEVQLNSMYGQIELATEAMPDPAEDPFAMQFLPVSHFQMVLVTASPNQIVPCAASGQPAGMLPEHFIVDVQSGTVTDVATGETFQCSIEPGVALGVVVLVRTFASLTGYYRLSASDPNFVEPEPQPFGA
jgi:hypothetical protein